MTEGSKFLLYLFMGSMGLIVSSLLFPFGPPVWILVGVIVAAIIWRPGRDADENSLDRTSCPSCGTPNPPDRETCKYCLDTL